MTGTTVVYQVADSTEISEDLEEGRSTSVALPDDYDPSQISGSLDMPSSSNRRCWIYVLASIILLVIAGAVTGILVRHKQSSENYSKDKSPSSNSTDSSPSDLAPVPPGRPESYYVNVINSYPHDTKAFLQGLEYSQSRDVFFESTGLTGGRSSLRRVNVTTGAVLQKVGLPSPALFGEGITLHSTNHVYMITWKAGRGFVFNQDTLKLEREWNYTGEGWGLSYDEGTDVVYMSDGTDEIRLLDPETLAEKRRIRITYNGEAVTKLNELEFVCGELWANVWQEKYIYRIDPKTGKIRSSINVPDLPLKDDLTDDPVDVLNGIAFDKKSKRLWITGKLWPKIYEVTISDKTFAKQCGD